LNQISSHGRIANLATIPKLPTTSSHQDTIHGFGRYYYNNGHGFEGMFRDGKRNGRGKYQLTDGRVEIYRYHNDSRVGSGVRWSANRKKAWLMNDGKAIKRVTLSEAVAIAKTCGPVVEES
jgi:hypothetical protein